MVPQARPPEDSRVLTARSAESLLKELLFIRKEAGFTPRRIAKAGRIRHLLGGEHEPFDNLRERMVSAIQSLRDDAELLLDVFGLSPQTEGLPLLRDRRAYYARKVGLSTDTVATREATALEHLRTQLTTGWYPKSPSPIRVPMTHNGAIQEFVQITTVIADRMWQETREHYRFVPAFEDVDFIAISRTKPGIPIPEGDFTVQIKLIGDSFTHRFYASEPMRRGQPYDLRFKMVPDLQAANSEVVLEESRGFHEPTRFATFEAVFLGDRPRWIWAYTGLTFFERPGEPTHGKRLDFKNGTSVKATFCDLYGGLHSGIAWRW